MILTVNNITCNIADKLILQNISFEVNEGEFIAIVGPNGAGKSTLLRCLLGILPVADGSIKVRDSDICLLPKQELARRIAYVPQMSEGTPDFSVAEFVLMSRFPYLKSFSGYSSTDREAADNAMARCGITHLSSRLLPTLSGGERQIAYIAAGLAQDAPILILDEPTVFLDPPHQDDVLKLLRQLHRDNITIVMVTHDINAAMAVSDRALALSDGRQIYLGASSGILDSLGDIFGNKPQLLTDSRSGKRLVAPAGWLSD